MREESQYAIFPTIRTADQWSLLQESLVGLRTNKMQSFDLRSFFFVHPVGNYWHLFLNASRDSRLEGIKYIPDYWSTNYYSHYVGQLI